MDFITEGFVQALLLLLHKDPETFSAIIASLKVSSCAMAMSIGIGLPTGFCLGYFDFPGKRSVRTLFDTLLSLPTVFIGLIVYALISRQGPLGNMGLLFTLPGIAIGQTILALPIIVALSAAVVEAMDPRLPVTLMSLGAGRKELLFGCIWELRHGLAAATLTAYGRVMTEVGISMMVGGNVKWHTRTITTAIALETNKGLFAHGIALGIVLLLIAFIVNLLIIALKR